MFQALSFLSKVNGRTCLVIKKRHLCLGPSIWHQSYKLFFPEAGSCISYVDSALW